MIVQYQDNDYEVGPDWVSQILETIRVLQNLSGDPGHAQTVKTELRLLREHIEDSLLNYNSMIDATK